MKLKVEVINPELNTFTGWLNLTDNENVQISEFINEFNGKTDEYRQRAANWSDFNHALLSVSEISAERLNDTDNSFMAFVNVEQIDIYDVTKALGVPSPIAALFSKMGEKGIASSFNTIFKLNRKLISREAVRQLSKRDMIAEEVYIELAV